MRKFGLITCILMAANVMALSVQEKYEVLTNENADSFGVAVYRIPEPQYCENEVEIWISAPKHSKRATFSLVDESTGLILSGSLQVQENVAEPIYAKGATYTDGSVDAELRKSQANYSFLSNGFRGVFLCVKQNYLSKLTIQFDDRYSNDLITKVWVLGGVSKWLE